MENEMIVMPDGSRLTLEECLDNLKNTRDYALYLDTLLALKERYLILLSVRDTPKQFSSNEMVDKLKAIGFSALTGEHIRTYIGIIDRGEVVYDKSADAVRKPMELSETISGLDLFMLSEPCKNGNSSITINGEEFSMNCRGFNIVVYDYETSSVIDSSTYDGYVVHSPFFHKLLWFDQKYIDEHFYIREKYKNEWTNFYQKSLFSNRKLGYKEIPNGIIEPVVYDKNVKGVGGCCDDNFNFIAGHVKLRKIYRCCSESYVPDNKEIDYIDETVIYAGDMFNHPGHILVENAGEFLWWVCENIEANFKIAITINQILFGDTPRKFIDETLDACGISLDRVLIVDKPTQFKSVIVPDQSQILFNGTKPYEYTKAFASFFEQIKSNVKPANFKKIYLARKKATKCNCIGEDWFIDFYKKKGFEIINPEDYTIKEKAALMMGADEVVSTIGTNTHFAVFCKPEVKLTILSRISTFHGPAQSLINQVADIKDMTIVDIGADFLHREETWGLYLVCVTDQFREYVKKTFNEDLDITPEESLKSVVFEYLKYFPEYYESNSTAFNSIKNQKMTTILQHMSEVFLGREFDTTSLDLKTKEDNLKAQVKKLTTDLDSAKKQIKELESGEVHATAKLIAETNEKLVKQIESMNGSASGGEKKKDTESELREKIKKLEKKVAYYENSRSWKITKPLRAIGNFFRKLFGKGK